MNIKLKEIINNYLRAIEQAINILVANNIPLPCAHDEWCSTQINSIYFQAKPYEYRKHGYGFEIQLSDVLIDFDFGSHGETNGFDLWRLTNFVEDNKLDFGLESTDDIEVMFSEAVSASEITKIGNLYFLASQTG